MAEHITFEKALEMMSKNENSQLIMETKQQHMKLLPKHIGNAKLGVSEQLKASLSLYSKILDGVPIAFKNVKSLQRLGQIFGSQACIHFDIVADFIIFKPSVGCTLRGVIHKIGNQHFGCLVHQCFNAWFPLENSGIDASPDLIGSEVEFKVVDIHTNNNVMSLKGEFIRFTDVKPSAVSLSQTNLIKKGTHTDLTKSMDDTMEMPTSSQMEPLFSSTMMETPLNKKKKKSKKKKKELDESCVDVTDTNKSNMSTEKINNFLKEDSVVSMNGECDSVLDDSSDKQKKKKRKRKSEKMNSDESDNVAAIRLESTKEQLIHVENISKSRKRKAERVEQRLVGNEDGEIAEITTPRKKTKTHKNKSTVAEIKQYDSSQDFQDTFSKSTHNKSKKKKKKEKK